MAQFSHQKTSDYLTLSAASTVPPSIAKADRFFFPGWLIHDVGNSRELHSLHILYFVVPTSKPGPSVPKVVREANQASETWDVCVGQL